VTRRFVVFRASPCSTVAQAVALLLFPGLLLAQAAQPPASSPSTDEHREGDGLQEVVVTAQFRSQDVQATPLAITAVTAEMLEARSQENVGDVANRAPNVTLTTSSGGLGGSQSTSVTIRGIGQNDFNLAVEPGVGMYVDDVYYGTMYGSLLDLIDLERVEILRGPQGTLSGKNSEGGAVKLFSKQPSSQEDGYGEVNFGSFNRRMLRAGMNFTVLPDRLFLRVTGLADRQDGYVTRYDYQCVTGQPADPLNNVPSLISGGPNGCKLGTEGGKDVIALRAALRFVPNDIIDDTLTYDDTRDRSEPAATVLTHQGIWHGPGFSLIGPPGANVTANFSTPPGSFTSYSSYCGLVATPSAYCVTPTSSLDSWGWSNVLNVALTSNLSFKAISAVRELEQSSVKDNDASPIPRGMNGWVVDYKQYTQELRLSGSHWEKLNWTIGGFWFKANALQGGRINLDGTADGSIPFAVTTDFLFNDPVHIESKSGFAHAEFLATNRLTFTAGVRYTDDYKKYDFVRYFAPGYTPGLVDGSIAATNGATGTFEGARWDYRATASYEVSSDLNVYAQFATGFKGGGINPRPYYIQQVQPFEPESVDAYEVGFKSRLLQNRLRLNVAAFHNKYSDIQLTLVQCPTLIPPGAPPNCYLPANVGSATIKGAEVEAELALGRLRIDSSASYLDFKYDSVQAATLVRLSDRPPYTPKYKFSAGAQYEFAIGTAGSITPRVDFQYQDETYSAARNFPNGRIPGYGLTNARLTYRSPDDKWQLSFAALNVFDKYYPLNIADNTVPQGTRDESIVLQPGRPREFFVGLKRQF
jgi:iron complex outermembrane recepter protein